MIIIDSALERLEKDRKPVRVGMVGAGFMAKGIALQLVKYVPGIRLCVICNRTLERARQAYTEADVKETRTVDSVASLNKAIEQNNYAVTDDPDILCESEAIDVVVEVTGAIEDGCHVILKAIAGGKHVVLMNAELDATLGAYLKHKADQQGVVYTNVDGDQPGVEMNLYRYVKGMGVNPVLCGNIKGLQDPYRTPTTQAGFAKQWKQTPHMVTSFADGSKISFEQALVANATGMQVGKRGMHGPVVEPGTPLEDVVALYPEEQLLEAPGLVDYVVGAAPAPGVFVLGTHDNAYQQHYLNLYKLGEGPFYIFYTPYHLCHFEVHNTIARAALFQDAAIAPDYGLKVEVVANAKKDLQAGETIDSIGGYMTYGVCENYPTANAESLLPLGIAAGCVLKRPISKDQTLTYDDIELPKDRTIDELRIAQAALQSQL